MRELTALEQLAGGNSVIHRLHPAMKLITAIVFIITVVSFDRYAFGRLIPYIFYPALLIALSETPCAMLLKRCLLALPFCLFAGIANVLWDRAAAFTVGEVSVSYGVVSFCTILLKAFLCVTAALLLMAVTPLAEITGSMRRLKMPNIFVTVFEMTYRYIGVLAEEAYSMHIAYSLRSPDKKGIRMKDMGSFVGQLLLRSVDRAERVYNAMKCRGYTMRSIPGCGGRLSGADFVFGAAVCVPCIALRFVNMNALFTNMGS